jgi:hypothetical protein
MRKPSRWVSAAVATVLAAVLVSSVSDARHRRRAPSQSHSATAAHTPLPPIPPAPQTPAPQTPPAVTQAPSAPPQTPPPPPSADVPTAAPAAKPEPSAIVLDTGDAQAILGKSVRSSAGEDMGRLVDVVVDRNGQPRAAVIDFGGFLGVGSRKIAVDWAALKFLRDDPKGNVITVELTRDQVKAAPEFKEGSAMVILGALGSVQGGSAAPPQNPPKTQETPQNPLKTQEK